MKFMKEKDIENLRKKHFNEFTQMITLHDLKFEEENFFKEKNFSWNKLDNEICINIFNEVKGVNNNGKGETFVMIEEQYMYDNLSFDILHTLKKHIEINLFLPTGSYLQMFYFNSLNTNPNILTNLQYILSRGWQLQINNITNEELSELVICLQDFTHYEGVNISLYSER